MTAYVVTAPYAFGYRRDGSHGLGVYKGMPFPTDGLADGEADRLVEAGLIGEVETVVAEQPAAPPARPLPDGVPPVNAPKSTWVDFAVTGGASRDDAEKATKDELIELYGKG